MKGKDELMAEVIMTVTGPSPASLELALENPRDVTPAEPKVPLRTKALPGATATVAPKATAWPTFRTMDEWKTR